MKYVIVDIDGTISKVGDRLKYLKEKPKNWDAFYDSCFEDEPIWNIVELVKSFRNAYNVVYCTGRRNSVRNLTEIWIKKYDLPYGSILMRPDHDHRHDTEVKPGLLEDNGIVPGDTAFILEDRNSMCKKWRELGFTCLQVAEGDF